MTDNILTNDEVLRAHIEKKFFIYRDYPKCIEGFIKLAGEVLKVWNEEHDPGKIIMLPKFITAFDKEKSMAGEPVEEKNWARVLSLIIFMDLFDFCDIEADRAIIERIKNGDFPKPPDNIIDE